MSSVCTSLVNLLTSFIALIIVIVITRSQVSWTFLLVIVPVIYTWMFAYGMGMILCVLVTAFRDVQHLYDTYFLPCVNVAGMGSKNSKS